MALLVLLKQWASAAKTDRTPEDIDRVLGASARSLRTQGDILKI